MHNLDAFFHFEGTLCAQLPTLPLHLGHPVYFDRVFPIAHTRGQRRPSRIHHDEMPELRESPENRVHLGQHRGILDKGHADIGMIKDVGNLLGRDIGRTRDISRPAELHRRIDLDPLEAVVGEDRHMVACRDTERDESLGKR